MTDEANSIWIAARKEIIELNLNSGNYQSYPLKNHIADGALIKEVNTSSHNQLILSTSGGPLLFDLNNRQFSQLLDQNNKVIDSNTWSATKTEDGHVLVSTIDGLYYSGNSSGTLNLIRNDSEAFKGASVYLYNDNNNKTWLFTDKESYQVNFSNGKPTFKKIKSYYGTAPIDRNLINFDADNDIWFGPYLYFDTKHDKYVELGHYQRSNNIKRFHSNQKHGALVFWGKDSTLIIDKSELVPLSQKQKIQLLSISSGSSSLPFNSAKSSYQVSSEKQEFTAKFAVIDPVYSKDIKYEYKLVGYDDNWRSSSFQERLASYIKLPPGDYSLSIMATNQLTGKTYPTLEIPIIVEAKYFQTIWFKLIIGGIGLLLIYFIVLWRVNIARQQERERFEKREAEQRAEMLNELMIKKNQLLSDVSHELGTPLTVLKLQVQALKDDLEDDVKATYDGLDRRITDISHLIGDLHQLAQADSNSLQLHQENMSY